MVGGKTLSSNADTAHVFVGSDRSQLIAVKVLEYSIRRFTSLNIVLRSMHDLQLPDPKDPRQGKRTGFSFTRFAIPKLMGYRGRAIYLDADMLVLRDFRELWSLPFDGCKIIIQEDSAPSGGNAATHAGIKKRQKQCSVMLLDCETLRWSPEEIIAGLDGRYSYEDLLYNMCILEEQEISYGVPFEWNSLEVFEPGKTGLIHYTDMQTQPWVYTNNPNAWVWLEELRLMLADASMAMSEIEREVALGYIRPSLIQQIADIGAGPARAPSDAEVRKYRQIDKSAGFRPHRTVNEMAARRQKEVEEYELRMGLKSRSLANSMLRLARRVGGKVRRTISGR